MKPKGCCRPLLLYQKIHFTYALLYGHEKREMIFYSSKHIRSHRVATNVKKFRDQDSNFSHETAGLLTSSTTISKKSTSHTPPHTNTKKEKWIFYSSKRISSHQMATNARNL